MRFILFVISFLPAVFLAGISYAETCSVRVHGMDVVIDETQFVDKELGTGRSERLWSAPERWFSELTGRRPQCRSDVTLTFMASLVETYTASGYCLDLADNDVGYLLLPGERNFRGRCVKTTCEKLVLASEEVEAVNDALSTILGSPPDIEEIARAESLGAMIVKGSDRYIRKKLNATLRSTILTTIGGPHAAAATALTVVALKSATYLCSE